jgi:phenylalanyl-tRNA synthetase beta chain
VEALLRKLRESFRGAGLTELMHYSLTKPASERQVTLANPLFPEYSALREDLIDGLIEAFEFNLNQGNGPLNGFEIGQIFWKMSRASTKPQRWGASWGAIPALPSGSPAGREQPLTWFEAKGVGIGVSAAGANGRLSP